MCKLYLKNSWMDIKEQISDTTVKDLKLETTSGSADNYPMKLDIDSKAVIAVEQKTERSQQRKVWWKLKK